jgi:hypothetical protein
VEPEPHHYGGAGAINRCGSGSDGSELSIHHWQKLLQFLSFLITFIAISIIYKSEDKVAPTLRVTCVCLQKVSLLYSMVGARAALKFLPGAAYK